MYVGEYLLAQAARRLDRIPQPRHIPAGQTAGVLFFICVEILAHNAEPMLCVQQVVQYELLVLTVGKRLVKAQSVRFQNGAAEALVAGRQHQSA